MLSSEVKWWWVKSGKCLLYTSTINTRAWELPWVPLLHSSWTTLQHVEMPGQNQGILGNGEKGEFSPDQFISSSLVISLRSTVINNDKLGRLRWLCLWEGFLPAPREMEIWQKTHKPQKYSRAKCLTLSSYLFSWWWCKANDNVLYKGTIAKCS